MYSLKSIEDAIHPFLANVLNLEPLKTPENQRFSGVFKGYKMRALTKNGLNCFWSYIHSDYLPWPPFSELIINFFIAHLLYQPEFLILITLIS